jgi:predicted flap endonuclease-1-like 5' DNA nuclease
LKQVKGIGPVFDEQLRLAGVTNLAKLTAMSATQLAEILDIGATRAANILAEAKKLG